MKYKDKFIREVKRIINKTTGKNIPLNPSNIIDKTAVIQPKVTMHSNIKIGKYSQINTGCYLYDDVEIGNYCNIAVYTLIGGDEHPITTLSQYPFTGVLKTFTKNHHTKKTIIGSDVWIGANAIIKRGTEIGTGAVIGAGSVVTKDIPPFAVAVGVPAKIIKFRFEESLSKRILDSKWWELDKDILNQLDFDDVNEDLDKIEQIVSSRK